MCRCFAGGFPLRFPLIAGALQIHCSQNPILASLQRVLQAHCRGYCRPIATVGQPLQYFERVRNSTARFETS